jgi:hypothetical protein
MVIDEHDAQALAQGRNPWQMLLQSSKVLLEQKTNTKKQKYCRYLANFNQYKFE